MTIGIASCGRQAGSAVAKAVLAAELMGRGAIGGFAVFAIVDENGLVQHRCTQRGGIGALQLPASWHGASRAAAISSGPDRPEPLVQFLPGRAGLGLVTGHRLPNMIGASGIPLNVEALDALDGGRDPQEVVGRILGANGEIDAGLIALAADGRIGWGNSARVARRDDVGTASRTEAGRGFALMHNSIYTGEGAPQRLADALAGIAWAELTGEASDHWFVELAQPVAFESADHDRIMVDADDRIVALHTANTALLAAEREGTAGYLSAPIWREGRQVGHAATDLMARMSGGVAYPLEVTAQRHMMGRRSYVAT